MTPNQLPPLPEPDTHCFDDDTGKDAWSYSADQMHAYALAALAQQAQEPVAWLYVDTVGDRYLCFSRPTGGGAITNLYATPPAPKPAPVDELIEALEDLMDWQVKNVKSWHNRAYDRAYRAIKKHRAALQSPAPQTKVQP